MISKEQFLDNTKEEEVFGVIHEFVTRYNEMMKEENKEPIVILDKDIGIISQTMITEIKSQVWIPTEEIDLT